MKKIFNLNLISILMLLLFFIALCSCSKKEKENVSSPNVNIEEISMKTDTSNVNDSKIKTNVNNLESINETDEEYDALDIIEAIEARLKIQEKLNNLKIDSKEDFLSDEEIANLTETDIKLYIAALFKSNIRNLTSKSLYHVFESGLYNKMTTAELDHICKYHFCAIEGNLDNIWLMQQVFEYAKNNNNDELLYRIIDNSAGSMISYYETNDYMLKLVEIYKDYPGQMQSIDFLFFKQNDFNISYEKKANFLDDFLNNANPKYPSYEQALKCFSYHTAIEQFIADSNTDEKYKEKVKKFYIYDLMSYLGSIPYEPVNDMQAIALKLVPYYTNNYQKFKDKYAK